MHLFFSTPIWTFKIDKYQTINNNMINYIIQDKYNEFSSLIQGIFAKYQQSNN